MSGAGNAPGVRLAQVLGCLRALLQVQPRPWIRWHKLKGQGYITVINVL